MIIFGILLGTLIAVPTVLAVEHRAAIRKRLAPTANRLRRRWVLEFLLGRDLGRHTPRRGTTIPTDAQIAAGPTVLELSA